MLVLEDFSLLSRVLAKGNGTARLTSEGSSHSQAGFRVVLEGDWKLGIETHSGALIVPRISRLVE